MVALDNSTGTISHLLIDVSVTASPARTLIRLLMDSRNTLVGSNQMADVVASPTSQEK